MTTKGLLSRVICALRIGPALVPVSGERQHADAPCVGPFACNRIRPARGTVLRQANPPDS
jgi:hypothetical protein